MGFRGLEKGRHHVVILNHQRINTEVVSTCNRVKHDATLFVEKAELCVKFEILIVQKNSTTVLSITFNHTVEVWTGIFYLDSLPEESQKKNIPLMKAQQGLNGDFVTLLRQYGAARCHLSAGARAAGNHPVESRIFRVFTRIRLQRLLSSGWVCVPPKSAVSYAFHTYGPEVVNGCCRGCQTRATPGYCTE